MARNEVFFVHGTDDRFRNTQLQANQAIFFLSFVHLIVVFFVGGGEDEDDQQDDDQQPLKEDPVAGELSNDSDENLAKIAANVNSRKEKLKQFVVTH